MRFELVADRPKVVRAALREAKPPMFPSVILLLRPEIPTQMPVVLLARKDTPASDLLSRARDAIREGRACYFAVEHGSEIEQIAADLKG